MTDASNPRVAVYIDFDNIVISRYNEIYGRLAFSKDSARNFSMSAKSDDEVARKLDKASVDLGAVLDYAAASGPIVISRAYADWSAPANAGYQRQLVDRAIDLTQLFSVTQAGKNGADIRLAVDVVEDLLRLSEITHVVLVAGDSDYIALAQRCKRLGRRIIGIGVKTATSAALRKACDEFTFYDELPGVEPVVSDAVPEEVAPDEPSPAQYATDLFVRAMRVLEAKEDDEDKWIAPGTVKNQMLRMDPAFKEKPLGFKTFTDFVGAQDAVVEIKPKTKSNDRRLRLTASAPS